MFVHTRRSPNGNTIPSWLAESGHVLMKRFDRKNKYQPIVEEVEVIEANPEYCFVKLKDGRETTVSNRHLAPCGRGEGEILDIPGQESVFVEDPHELHSSLNDSSSNTTTQNMQPLADTSTSPPQPDSLLLEEPPMSSEQSLSPPSALPRRSERIRHLPRYLEDYSVGE
ncbi:uncharacterized protein [Diabrotica undecimpunctata]|uniref:uncharacterized protein n=1 Tax=Diabrotica undecimpunctata TaxID=50387 RepID=UPI003B633C3C